LGAHPRWLEHAQEPVRCPHGEPELHPAAREERTEEQARDTSETDVDRRDRAEGRSRDDATGDAISHRLDQEPKGAGEQAEPAAPQRAPESTAHPDHSPWPNR